MMLDVLAFRDQGVDPLARGAHDDVGVETTGQTAVDGGDDHQVALSEPVPASSLGAPSPETPAARLAITAAMRWA